MKKQSIKILSVVLVAILMFIQSCKKEIVTNNYYYNSVSTSQNSTNIFNFKDTIIVSQKPLPIEFSVAVNVLKNNNNEVGVNALLKSPLPPYGWNIKYTLYDKEEDKKISEHEYTRIQKSDITFKVLGFPTKKNGKEYKLKIETKPYGSRSIEKQNTFEFKIKN
jgi:hypothetical protein